MTRINGFTYDRLAVNGTEIHVCHAGTGPAILCLHGYPQTHYMWHKIAPLLAADYTVVLPDLRGYGDSGKPDTDAEHSPYSKRVMAQDLAQIMARLGHQHYAVIGHDRGGRVAHRLARDYREHVAALAVLDIAPTLDMYEATDMRFAMSYYHWFFLTQPAPLPEQLIGADAEFYLEKKLGHWGKTPEAHTPEAVAEYKRCFCQPATIHASCEDYRAAASIDLDHDREDRDQMLDIPVLALWGERGFVGKKFDVLSIWRAYAHNVSGHGVPGGHFLPEEAPEETLAALQAFLAQTLAAK